MRPFALLLLAALSGGCAAPGEASRTDRTGAGTPVTGTAIAAPASPTPVPTPIPVPVVRAATPPTAPPGPSTAATGTSDRGSRLARPTPIGQIAPEEVPTADR